MTRSLTTLAAALSLVAAFGVARLDCQSLGMDDAAAQSLADGLIPRLRASAGIKLYPPVPVRFVTREAFAEALAVELRETLLTVRRSDGHAQFAGPAGMRTAETLAAALAPRFVVRYVGGPDGGLLLVPENRAVVPGRSTRDVRRHVESALAREMARLSRAESAKEPASSTLDAFVARLALGEACAAWAAERVTHHPASPRMSETASVDDAGRMIDAIVGNARATAIGYVARLHPRDADSWAKLVALQPTSIDAFGATQAAPPKQSPLTVALAALDLITPAGEWSLDDAPQDAAAMTASMRDAIGERRATLIAKGLVRGVRRTATHPSRGQTHLTLFEMASPSSGFAYVVAQRQVIADRDRRLAEADVAVERQAPRTIKHSAFPVLESTTTSIIADDRTTTITRVTGVCRHYCFELVTTEAVAATDRKRFLDALAQHLEPTLRTAD